MQAQTNVTVTIPAAHLEDFRTALANEIRSDSEMVHRNQQDVLKGSYSGREDLASAVRYLQADTRLLDRVLGVDDTTTVEGDEGAVVHVLHGVIRVLSDRMAMLAEYEPVELDKVLGILDALRWATTEANRIEVQEGARPTCATILQDLNVMGLR